VIRHSADLNANGAWLMRRLRVIPVVLALTAGMAQPAVALSGPNVGALTCLNDLTGRWQVNLVAPGYQKISAFTWAFDSAYLATAPTWNPATGFWWGGADRVWFFPFNSPNATWQGPFYNSTVLYATHNTGRIYVNEYQWDAAAQAWETARSYDCPTTQWVPSIYRWPGL
jgi:hypothetical protein